MTESTKINFPYRRISQLSDFTELIELLFPGNPNQQHAAACIYYELKWDQHLVPNMAYLENKYSISRRILQRARAKLSRLGVIEYITFLNARYGGQQGWKLSTRFQRTLNQLSDKCAALKYTANQSLEKEQMLLQLLDAKRSAVQKD